MVKLNGPEWLPRAQETHWPCKASMCLHIAAVWGNCPAWNGGAPGSIFRLFDNLGVSPCFLVGWHHVFCLVEEEAVSSPWGH